VRKPAKAVIHTHHRVDETHEAVSRITAALRDAGVDVIADAEEAEKHPGAGLTVVEDTVAAAPEIAVILGGDGTMLAALRDYARTDTVVFSFNYGAVGFLATIDRDQVDEGIRRILEEDYEVLTLPTLVTVPAAGPRIAVNDITFLRRTGARVAELAYLVRGELLAQARCDGLVVSTAVGSTGYNLANGGPIMAWGVEGYVVSYIAPHTLTARTLVAATTDVLVVRNLSREESVDVETDGRRVCSLEPGQDLEVRFEDHPARLAKLPGTGFYDQLREKFGRLVG
jgi:NAD+ kinase